jgi:hypothetical protein
MPKKQQPVGKTPTVALQPAVTIHQHQPGATIQPAISTRMLMSRLLTTRPPRSEARAVVGGTMTTEEDTCGPCPGARRNSHSPKLGT